MFEDPSASRSRLSLSRCSSSPSSSSTVVSLYPSSTGLIVSFLVSGLRGRIKKKLISMMIGRKADARSAVLLLNPNDVVASAYAPAPISPAPPVPLPQAAKLKGP